MGQEDRIVVRLDDHSWAVFQAALAAPPRLMPRMVELLSGNSHFAGPEDPQNDLPSSPV